MATERYKYRQEIQQMMFVSGATNDPPAEVINLVEDIVRAQVVEIIAQCGAIARRRGSRGISVEDVMFLFHHDAPKVNLLVNYLTWKDVRKNTRDTDAAPETEILEEVEPVKKPKKVKGKSSTLGSMFNMDLSDSDSSDDEDDEAAAVMVERLKTADDRTRGMTKEEYVHWSECRQASFTYRKAKRFKDWVGMSHLTDARIQDDIIDILGFLTFEIVANLTEAALRVKKKERRQTTNGPVRKQSTLFDRPNNDETPLEARHVREAWRRYQQPSIKQTSLRRFSRGNYRFNGKFI